MSRVRHGVAFLCLLAILPGCNRTVSLSPDSRSSLVPEDASSPVMKEENYQAMTQAIALKKDISGFLNQQPDLAKKTFGGKPLLFDAAFFGNKEAAQALLDHGADINFTTQLGETALDRAVSSKSEEVITLLKQRGATTGRKR